MRFLHNILPELEKVLIIAGMLLIGIYVGSLAYARGYQIYARYAFESALRQRSLESHGVSEVSISATHMGGRTNLPDQISVTGNLARADEKTSVAYVLRHKGKRPGTDVPFRGAGILGQLEIPAIGLSVMALEGSGDLILSRGVGHVEGTPPPGASGNVVFAGHRDTFFRGLRKISRGDEIRVSTADGRYRYGVEETSVVDPQDISVMAPTTEPALTLITCYPFSFIGNAPKRFVVRARLLSGSLAMPE